MKSFPDLTFDERVDWAAGYILQELIRGRFRDAVYLVLNQCYMHPILKPKVTKPR